MFSSTHRLLIHHQMCGGFPTQSNAVTPAGYPAIQFNSDTDQNPSRSHRWRAWLHRLPFSASETRRKLSLGLLTDQLWVRILMTPLFGFGDFLERLPELREMFTYASWAIKRRGSEGYNEKPDGEIDRARFRNNPRLGVSVPVAGACHPPHVWLC